MAEPSHLYTDLCFLGASVANGIPGIFSRTVYLQEPVNWCINAASGNPGVQSSCRWGCTPNLTMGSTLTLQGSAPCVHPHANLTLTTGQSLVRAPSNVLAHINPFSLLLPCSGCCLRLKKHLGKWKLAAGMEWESTWRGGCRRACLRTASVQGPGPVRSSTSCRTFSEKRSPSWRAMCSHTSLSAGCPGAAAKAHCSTCDKARLS